MPVMSLSMCASLSWHSPTSIALFDEHNGVLFPGDVVYDAFLRDNCAAADRFTDRATKLRLRPLPVSAVRPGYENFDQPRLHQIIDTYLDPVSAERPSLQPSPGTARTKAPPRRPLRVSGHRTRLVDDLQNS
jgi:glyoxylase-like metal-dependent hydrolase (beta-lactamase superfamily II)